VTPDDEEDDDAIRVCDDDDDDDDVRRSDQRILNKLIPMEICIQNLAHNTIDVHSQKNTTLKNIKTHSP